MESKELIEKAVYDILVAIGEDPKRDGLLKTPHRVAKAWLEDLVSGYRIEPASLLQTTFEEGDCEKTDNNITVGSIEFVSLCEHHMLPFHGLVHIGYLPSEGIVGLSKFERLVDAFAHRLQVQEKMTSQIANTIMEVLKPKGCGVVVEAVHTCMSFRGVRKQNSITVTNAMRGLYKDDKSTLKQEFLWSIQNNRMRTV